MTESTDNFAPLPFPAQTAAVLEYLEAVAARQEALWRQSRAVEALAKAIAAWSDSDPIAVPDKRGTGFYIVTPHCGEPLINPDQITGFGITHTSDMISAPEPEETV